MVKSWYPISYIYIALLSTVLVMCILIHMIKNYDKYFQLKDSAQAYEVGKLELDKRVQVKFPSFLISMLDEQFPNANRSEIITRAVTDYLLQYLRIKTPDLVLPHIEEQRDLDVMWNYLGEREGSNE